MKKSPNNKPQPTEPTNLMTKIKSNWLRRTIGGVILVTLFTLMIYIGLLPILLATLAIQIKCFDEIINIAYNINKTTRRIPYFRTINWYFVIAANYFFYGETFADHFEVYTKNNSVLWVLVAYHRFFSFCWYFIGIIWFVFSLVRKNELRKQFSFLACTHFLLIIIVMQSYMIVENVFLGLVWLIVPVSTVTINDIFAYIFGRLYGKTPLIEVSPKKTKEGYVYGAVFTVIFTAVLCHYLSTSHHMICPIEFVETADGVVMKTDCTPGYLFQPTNYHLGDSGYYVTLYPFVLHSFSLSLFASVIAPFGGFFASGFKRAFNVKDFSDIIPGHGGITDRFDCQYLMATFVNVYISTFIRIPNIEKIFSKVLYLSDNSQLQFYYLLEESLKHRNISFTNGEL